MTHHLSSHDYVRRLTEAFSEAADPFMAVPMQRYMRDQFPFYGIKTPERRAIMRTHTTAYGLPETTDQVMEVAALLWERDERECQYAACGILERRRSVLHADALPFVEGLVCSKSWWDTVDVLAPKIIGSIVRTSSALHHQWSEAWIESDNFWLQRTAIIAQLSWKEHTDVDLLAHCILRRASSTEFFVRKASGWALRQYAYVAPAWVRSFVEQHRSVLSGLTIREATKHC